MGRRQPQTTKFIAGEPEAVVDVALLGPLEVTFDGSSVDVSGPKRRALLILLALNAGNPLSRDRIIDALWPSRQTGREESTLRVHVSHLRDALEPSREAEPSVLLTRGSAYVLAGDNITLDTDRFDLLAREGRAALPIDPGTAVELLNEALGMWRGRPLQDVEYEDFAQEEIRRLEGARAEAIENRAEALLALEEDAAAIEDLEPLVRADPAREGPVRLLMRALYRTGRQADALRIARLHSRSLAERGLDPSPQIELLEERILQHDQTLMPAGSVSPAEIRPGRSIRGYELRREAGSGSIGIVYQAFQASVGREVAIKVVHPDLAQTPGFVRRFAEEARTIAGLEHPHIVPLYDFWREPTGAFLVMRWMHGGSLRDRIDRVWSDEELGRVFDQLADALSYAHSAGVVHRDVRPANALFDKSGNAYLGDFGLAVTGVETGVEHRRHPGTIEPPYASPELIRGEGPTVASDIFALGVMLGEAGRYLEARENESSQGVGEVVKVATSPNPADRYPDMTAFRSALRQAMGPTVVPAPRRVRRNPFKGLEPFTESDHAYFYGRDDVVDSLLDVVNHNGLTALIGASGSGKSSVVMAGLVPQIRNGALPGSEEWSVVYMVPGIDPFEEFHIGLRAAAVGGTPVNRGEGSRELRDAFAHALDGPGKRALLVVDQFEELFSSGGDEVIRERFIDNLVDLTTDPAHRVRMILTLRADFSDRPLTHATFGDLMSKASVLLAPMRSEQIEDVIRGPATRVGVQVEPGLISEIMRDVTHAPAFLPLLQYVLSELFERRHEDRLTVEAYRSLGGVHGVLERQAEATYASLDGGAQQACRQLFLRLVHLGEHGEETRRRLPVFELRGLGHRSDVDEALAAFAVARLITHDRDPVTRTPTVELAHETVISRWTRYRIWLDEARADILAHRRISAAATTWADAEEDPSYLLTGGPLAAALDVVAGERVTLNDLEILYVNESAHAEEAARMAEVERQRREATLSRRARTRLVYGIGIALIAVVVAVLAGFAFVQRQEASDLAAQQERQNLARELAAQSISSLTLADPDLSLLLAIAAAEQSVEVGEPVLPEAVEALHRAVISPRPDLIIPGAGRELPRGHIVMSWSRQVGLLGVINQEGGATVIDPESGDEQGGAPSLDPPAFGVDFQPDGTHLLTIHPDGVRVWDWRSKALIAWIGPSELDLPDDVAITTARASPDGSLIAIGASDGVIRLWDGRVSMELVEHTAGITSLDFNPSGDRIVSGGADMRALVWDLASASVVTEAPGEIVLQVVQTIWNPGTDQIAITLAQGEAYLFDATTGDRINSFSSGNQGHNAITFDSSGAVLVGAGPDGFTRLYGSGVGGAPFVTLPNGGVPVRDVETDPDDPFSSTIATVDADGFVRIWRDTTGRSELPSRPTTLLYPVMASTPEGERYAFAGYNRIYGLPLEAIPFIEVIDASTGETLFRHDTRKDFNLLRHPGLSDDGSLLAFAGPDGDVRIVDIDTGEERIITGSANWTKSLHFNHDNRLLAGAGFDTSIAVWDVETGDLVDFPPNNEGPAAGPTTVGAPSYNPFSIDDADFHPGRDELAWTGLEGTIHIWNLDTGEDRIVHRFDHHARSTVFSEDGRLLAAADSTGTVVVIDAESGDLIDVQPERVSGETELVFSPDGKHLAGAGPGRVAHLWDLETGRIVRRFEGAIGPPQSLGFVNGGEELRVADAAGFDLGYVVDPLRLLEIAKDEVGRAMSEKECRLYLHRPCDG